MAEKHQEHIVAVNAAGYNNMVALQRPEQDGFLPIELFEGLHPFPNEDVVVAHRRGLETNEAFRQIIPYILFRDTDDRFLAYRRTKKGNESRIHDKVSIGIGGHVDMADVVIDSESVVDIDATLMSAVRREVEEELGKDFADAVDAGIMNFSISGLVVDSESAVERVHVAALILIRVGSSGRAIIDNRGEGHGGEGIATIGFLSREELAGGDRDLERWSRIALNHQ